ncbi:JNK1/MAPK8-associated membrane protein isoform X5 [Mugil cephalus]|uniref:JNK1/MAPK8-associated membrane protein isoform X5 n=1 Tax=Mugil cephalus TaxID=48193 RepID=UPI001FB79128|nr:JNK1/MAPK8-associated membrane protein isoform X5 [Mugil cephalus]
MKLRTLTTQSARAVIGPLAVAKSPTCPGLYCGRLIINGSVEGECGQVCPRGERANIQKVCELCTGSPDLYDWLYLGFMAMLPLVLHWFFIEWYSGKKSYTIVLLYYAFCLVLMMLLRPLLVKKMACGLGKSDRFKSIYAALYFFPILTLLQAVGGGLLYYAFPYIILVMSLVTLAVYMSASEIQCFKNLIAKKKRLVVLFSHWLLHAYGIISISRLDKMHQDLPMLALVPGPALFYIATAKFTEPSRILSESGNGH